MSYRPLMMDHGGAGGEFQSGFSMDQTSFAEVTRSMMMGIVSGRGRAFPVYVCSVRFWVTADIGIFARRGRKRHSEQNYLELC